MILLLYGGTCSYHSSAELSESTHHRCSTSMSVMRRSSSALVLLIFHGGITSALTMHAACRPNRPLMVRRSHITTACASKDSTDTTAAEKRREAQRLALQAERAALELEQLELEAEELRLKAPPAPAPEVAMVEATLDAPASKPEVDVVPEAAPEDGPFAKFLGALNVSDVDEPPPSASAASVSLARALDGQSAKSLQLTDAQVAIARERVFDVENFYVTKVEQSFLGTIFRGNMRGNSTKVYARVAERADSQPTLDGVLFLLIEDPIAMTLEDLQNGAERRPVFLALPAKATLLKQKLPELGVCLLSLFITTITTLGFTLSTYILADGGRMLEQMQVGDTAPLETAAPMALGLAGVQLVHEAAHLVAARIHGLRTGVPLVLPSLQVGGFGAVTKLLSFPRSRTVRRRLAFSTSSCVAHPASSRSLHLAYPSRHWRPRSCTLRRRMPHLLGPPTHRSPFTPAVSPAYPPAPLPNLPASCHLPAACLPPACHLPATCERPTIQPAAVPPPSRLSSTLPTRARSWHSSSRLGCTSSASGCRSTCPSRPTLPQSSRRSPSSTQTPSRRPPRRLPPPAVPLPMAGAPPQR